MYLARATVIIFGAFVTIAGAPGPDDVDETFRYEGQQGALSDGNIPAEAENIQRPNGAFSLEDEDVSTGYQPDATVSEKPIEISEPVSSLTDSDGSEIELTLSNDYIQGRYFPGRGILGFDQAQGHVGIYVSDERDIIGSLGVMTEPFPAIMDGLTIAAGARSYLALLADPNDDVFGVAPGLEARYVLPYFQQRQVNLAGGIFYSPNILTLGDATDILDLDVRLEAEIIPRLVGLIGYREFRFDSDEGDDKRAASEIQVGARFDF